MKETVAKATQKQVPNVNSGIRVSMILDRLVNKQDRRRLPLSPCKKKKSDWKPAIQNILPTKYREPTKLRKQTQIIW